MFRAQGVGCNLGHRILGLALPWGLGLRIHATWDLGAYSRSRALDASARSGVCMGVSENKGP